jgi:hypothetical protein
VGVASVASAGAGQHQLAALFVVQIDVRVDAPEGASYIIHDRVDELVKVKN